MRLLDGAAVRRLLDMPSCIEAMRRAFRLVSSGQAEQPIRTALESPEKGLLGLMPGRLDDPEVLGLKVVSIFPGNFDRGKPTHMGMVLLFDPDDGAPLALLDAHAVTMIRTAAASAVATDLLARRDARTLALLGYGDQAVSHLEAIRLVREIDRVLVWGRRRDRAEAFAAEHGVEVADSVESAVAAADIVCTLTASPEPVLFGRWLRPGQHVNAVGASVPSMEEIDTEVVARSRYFADYRASCESLAGDFRRAVADGKVQPSHLLGEIGEILNGTLRGRTDAADITCFRSLGMAAEDLAAAELILRRAKARDVGVEVGF
jgi:ornithine cyclodeaminase/alanine dehydrogenase-like protein (mu-crystallin family)